MIATIVSVASCQEAKAEAEAELEQALKPDTEADSPASSSASSSTMCRWVEAGAGAAAQVLVMSAVAKRGADAGLLPRPRPPHSSLELGLRRRMGAEAVV